MYIATLITSCFLHLWRGESQSFERETLAVYRKKSYLHLIIHNPHFGLPEGKPSVAVPEKPTPASTDYHRRMLILLLARIPGNHGSSYFFLF